MPHIDDGQLNALLDGELSAADARTVESHIAGCDLCRRRLADARRFLTEASELLGGMLPPSQRPVAVAPPADAVVPPPAAVTPPPAVPGAGTPPRRVSKTAREVAIDIDGSTGKSPAIRLFPLQQERHGAAAAEKEEAEPAATRRVPWTQIAWAASIVLTFSVGYLANELRDSRRADGTIAQADSTTRTLAAADPAVRDNPTSEAPAQAPRRGRSTSQLAPRDVASGAGAATTPTAGREQRQAGELSGIAGARAPAHEPAPTIGAAPMQAAADTSARADYLARSRAAEGPRPQDADARRAVAPRLEAPATPAAPAPAPARPRTFRRTTLDTAVVRLSGSIRLVDGMEPDRVEIGPGSLIPGASPDVDVVRIFYSDARGRRIVLDQQRLPAERDAGAAAVGDGGAAAGAVGLLYGDTIVTTTAAVTRVRWLDNKNFWLSLSGPLEADSLRVLVGRVR